VRAAVVGGGVFGCVIAVDLARTGAQVTLYESRTDILEGSTARNMARLHSGYHYPRSDETAAASRDAAALFAARFPQAIRRASHYYVVAPGSKVSAADYLAFCDRLGLPYEVCGEAGGPVTPPQVHCADLVAKVAEAFVDVDVLRRLLRRELTAARVTVRTGERIAGPEAPDADVTVWATYGVPWTEPLRYEVCEVALLELGRYGNDSFVVVDGEYVSLDPFGRRHTLYDVTHSVHHVSVDTRPDIPSQYLDLIGRYGPARSPLSNLDRMVESASRFLWGLDPYGQHAPIYHGSLWSLRAVLPDVDATDTRPTLIERDGDVIRVLSGKFGTAALAGRRVVDEVFGRVLA
jgi:hypothetical protein